jgi:hypothetical protein
MLVKPQMENEEQKDDQITEEMDFSNPSFKFIPSGRHSYRQEGGYLVCRTCELHHAVYIGMEKIMVGEKEDGTPILKKR